MTLTLTLPEDLEQRLAEEARRHGVGEEELTIKLLGQHLPETNRQVKLAALIRSWIDQGDQAEQQATGEFLIQALDEDRLSDRKLFPPELRGQTW